MSADEAARTRIVVVVHAGSACGSADFNIGRDAASSYRQKIVDFLRSIGRNDGYVRLRGGLDPEVLQREPALAEALQLASFKARGPGGSFPACDDKGPGAAAGMKAAIRKLGLDPKRHRIVLTGAWYDPDDRHGCVNAAAKVCRSQGFETEIHESAVPTKVPAPFLRLRP